MKAGETPFGVGWVPGRNGVFDGVLAFSDGTGRTLSYRGFEAAVDGQPVGLGDGALRCVKTHLAAGHDALSVVHHVDFGGKGVRRFRVRFTPCAEQGVLRMAWDMPGVRRDADGEPRYTHLSPGAGSAAPERVYLGFGNVIVRPVRLDVAYNGFALSTRHVGADYPNGLSLTVATDVPPDKLVCDRAGRLFALQSHHDTAYFFAPAADGAFAAARRFAAVSGYRRSRGWETLAGRMCLDQWTAPYAESARDLGQLAGYGRVRSQRFGFRPPFMAEMGIRFQASGRLAPGRRSIGIRGHGARREGSGDSVLSP